MSSLPAARVAPYVERRRAVPPPLTGPEGGAAELAALVRACIDSEAVREVTWLQLSRLPRGLDRPHHRRLLREALALPHNARRARLFHLPNGDLAAATAPPDSLGAAMGRVLEGVVEEAFLPQLIRNLRLPEESAGVLAALEESLGLAESAAPRAAARPAPPIAAVEALAPVLERAEVESLLRRQPVCRMTQDGAPEMVAEAVAPHPRALEERLLEGRSLGPVPEIAARLAEMVAPRLLAATGRAEWVARPAPLHLSLPVSAVASEAFLRMDARVPRALKPYLTLCLAAAEVVAAPGAFRLARELARAQGYALALEAPGAEALALLPPARLGVDLVRLAWSGGLPLMAGPVAAVVRAGIPVTLTGADRTAAIAWGWEVGIAQFQGKATDRRLRAG